MIDSHLSATPEQIADEPKAITYCGAWEYATNAVTRNLLAESATADVELVTCQTCLDLFEQDEEEREERERLAAEDLRFEPTFERA